MISYALKEKRHHPYNIIVYKRLALLCVFSSICFHVAINYHNYF